MNVPVSLNEMPNVCGIAATVTVVVAVAQEVSGLVVRARIKNSVAVAPAAGKVKTTVALVPCALIVGVPTETAVKCVVDVALFVARTCTFEAVSLVPVTVTVLVRVFESCAIVFEPPTETALTLADGAVTVKLTLKLAEIPFAPVTETTAVCVPADEPLLGRTSKVCVPPTATPLFLKDVRP